jgi:putative molybdopterin biosynthesis protein
VAARLARKVFSTPGFDEFVQVKIGIVDDKVVAVPLPRGSGVSMSMVRSDGVIKVPARKEGVARWDVVEVLLHGQRSNVEGTILAIGSHDVSIDLLASRIKREDSRLSLASANVGSMGGIMAVREGQAHVAGTHLLDEETGDFNVPYVLRQCSPSDVLLVHLAMREQGLMVPPGNPKNITCFEDLAREGVVFVNRQRGSGTRLLLDYQLGKAQIDTDRVTGYSREMFTHTSVAAAVAGGTADVGLGVLAAARALKLEFVPVAMERYDLLMIRSFMDHPGFGVMMNILADDEYRREVEALGGYDLSNAGELIPLEGS